MIAPYVSLADAIGANVSDDESVSPERAQEIAQDFEAMFIHQMLRQIRQESAWNNPDGDLFGTELMETIDVELARELAKGGGLGLADVLLPLLNSSPDEPTTLSPEVLSIARTLTTMSPPRRPDRGAPVLHAVAAPTAVVPPETAPVPAASSRMDEVTSPFGWRRDPFVGTARFHGGVDLRAAYGEEVSAVRSGVVTHAGAEGSYGLTVVIEHETGVVSRSAHLSSVLVEEGESVSAGQVVGRAGSSGRATGPHLHFELTRDGRRIDPMAEPGEMSAVLKGLDPVVDFQGDRQQASYFGAGAEHHED